MEGKIGEDGGGRWDIRMMIWIYGTKLARRGIQCLTYIIHWITRWQYVIRGRDGYGDSVIGSDTPLTLNLVGGPILTHPLT